MSLLTNIVKETISKSSKYPFNRMFSNSSLRKNLNEPNSKNIYLGAISKDLTQNRFRNIRLLFFANPLHKKSILHSLTK